MYYKDLQGRIWKEERGWLSKIHSQIPSPFPGCPYSTPTSCFIFRWIPEFALETQNTAKDYRRKCAKAKSIKSKSTLNVRQSCSPYPHFLARFSTWLPEHWQPPFHSPSKETGTFPPEWWKRKDLQTWTLSQGFSLWKMPTRSPYSYTCQESLPQNFPSAFDASDLSKNGQWPFRRAFPNVLAILFTSLLKKYITNSHKISTFCLRRHTEFQTYCLCKQLWLIQ